MDNSKGAEPEFAAGLRDVLSAAGFEVELREPAPEARYDTRVHLVVEGVAIRVSEGPGRARRSFPKPRTRNHDRMLMHKTLALRSTEA